jgi:hypothetical protein
VLRHRRFDPGDVFRSDDLDDRDDIRHGNVERWYVGFELGF